MNATRGSFGSRVIAALGLPFVATLALAGAARANEVTLNYAQPFYGPGEQPFLEITGPPGSLALVLFDFDPGPTNVPGIGTFDLGFTPQLIIILPPVTIPDSGMVMLACPIQDCDDTSLFGIPIFGQALTGSPPNFDPCISNQVILLYDDPTGICTMPGDGSIGDFVWCDLDDDGAQDPGEPGIPGVTVDLVCAGMDGIIGTADDITDSMVTNASGMYLFTMLPEGTCVVTVDVSTAPPDKVVGMCPTTVTVDLDLDETFLDADFCFKNAPPGEIGDTVFCDENDNGVQDPGEPGIPGVTVVLRCVGPDGAPFTADDLLQMQVTDANGNYLFTGVPADFCAVFAVPATAPPDKEVGMCPLFFIVDLQPAQSFLDADFCFKNRPGKIGDTVYCDENDNGVQDPGEPGIAGVLVTLVCDGPDGIPGTADDFVSSQLTSVSGNYLFSFVPAGNCVVTVDPSTAPPDKEVGMCPTTITVDLQPAQVFLDADFCFKTRTGEIGDTVFCDLDDDGVQDPGEPGIPGVTVDLVCEGPDSQFGTADDITDSQVTDANGNYLFTEVIPAVCMVTVDVSTAPPDKEVGMCPITVTVNLQPGQSFLDADFCFKPRTSEIGDTVFCDLDNDGIQDAGEPGIPGVTVDLVCAGPDGVLGTADDITDSQVTDAAGMYLFTDLPAGDCVVTVDVSTAPPDKEVGMCPPTVTVPLQPGESFLDADFCFRFRPGEIGDFVWCDLDNDGIQDAGEPGIPDVTVDLACAGPDGVLGTADDFVASQVTDAGGFYLFTMVPPGTCLVTVDVSTAPPDKTVGMCPTTVTVDLQPAQSFLDADFCFIPESGQIGDTVFCDLDNDGVQDAGEPGISGVTVNLTCAGPDGVFGTADDVMDSMVTDANGMYLFTDVPAGLCEVVVDTTTVPSDKTTGMCPTEFTVDLQGGQSFLDADFCFVECMDCSGGVNSLTLRYDGTLMPAMVVVRRDSVIFFSGNVNPGESFTFVGNGTNNKFPNDIFVFVNGVQNTSIHTSCSQPIAPGLTFGDFFMVAGTSVNGGPICPLGPCDAGKPCLLTLEYTGESCAASDNTQGNDTCTGDPMLASPVRIRASNSSDPTNTGADVFFDGEVALGATFDVESLLAGETKLPSNTWFHIIAPGTDMVLQTISIHTSCSQPLDLGDQFGSLILRGFTAEGMCEPPDDLPPCVGGKPCELDLRYTGESCAATMHSQDPSKVSCSGDPMLASPVFIRSSDKSNPNDVSGNVWFEGVVMLDEVFTIASLNAGQTKLGSDTWVHVFTAQGGSVLQTVRFHTSCSQPLNLGDQFGSIVLEGFTAEGTCTPGPDADQCIGGGDPQILTLEYTGEDCSATDHGQDPSKVSCSGDPMMSATVMIRASNKANPMDAGAEVYFMGMVGINTTFDVSALNAMQPDLASETFVHVFSLNGTLLQQVRFHTSCSQPLVLGDQYGSLVLTGFVPE